MKTLSIILFILSFTLFNGCTKQKGCTDPKATNFSSDAEEDCHCCKYEGNIVFWYGKSTADYLKSIGSTSLVYYFDGKIVGSSAANIYWTGAPNCGQNSSITVNKDLGESKSKAYTFKIIDQDNDVIWEGVRNIEANKCLQLQLTH